MVSDLDIYRSANELIKQHGEDAPSPSQLPTTTATSCPPPAILGRLGVGSRLV